MNRDPRSIANFLLDEAQAQGLEITNLALNKILYFCHAWYLAQYKLPLLSTTFEAWDHGPVIPSVYHQFKRHKNGPISSRATMIDLDTGLDVIARASLELEEKAYLRKMLAFYGVRTGSTLRNMSHEPGAPWDQVRQQAPEPGMVIPDRIIAEYFSLRLDGRNTNAH